MPAHRHVAAECERGQRGHGHDGRAAGAVHQPGVVRASRAPDGGRGTPARPARARLPAPQCYAYETRAQSITPPAEQSAFCCKFYYTYILLCDLLLLYYIAC